MISFQNMTAWIQNLSIKYMYISPRSIQTSPNPKVESTLKILNLGGQIK